MCTVLTLGTPETSLHMLVLPRHSQVVPKDKARIRVQLSAGHTTEQVNQAVDAFIAVGKQLGVIPGPARL